MQLNTIKKTTVLLSNEEIDALVQQYQESPSEELYAAIHAAVFPMAEKVALKQYHKSTTLANQHHLIPDDFTACAYMAVLKALDKFDFNKAKVMNFTASVKKMTLWTINDDIYKQYQTKGAEFHKELISYDIPVADEMTKLEAIENELSDGTDVVLESLLEKHENTENKLSNILLNLVKDFSACANAADTAIIKTWVATLLSNSECQTDLSKKVNNALSAIMPDVPMPTVRKKKSRAEKKFNIFAQENGYGLFNLSHF